MNNKSIKLKKLNKFLTIENYSSNGQRSAAVLKIIKISDDPEQACHDSLETYLKEDGSVETIIRGSSGFGSVGFGAIIEGKDHRTIQDKLKTLSLCLEEMNKVLDDLQKPKQVSLFE